MCVFAKDTQYLIMSDFELYLMTFKEQCRFYVKIWYSRSEINIPTMQREKHYVKQRRNVLFFGSFWVRRN